MCSIADSDCGSRGCPTRLFASVDVPRHVWEDADRRAAAPRTLSAWICALSIPAPIITSKAFASKMNGKGYGCPEGVNWMSKRYKQATKGKAGTKAQ
jgi:hypothetical protein